MLTTWLPDPATPKMPAIKVPFCVPCVPMRILLPSPATPALPISMLLLPVEICARTSAQRDVIAAGVIIKRVITCGRIVCAGGVVIECAHPAGCVLEADGVSIQRITAVGRVVIAGAVVVERTITGGRAVPAACVCPQARKLPWRC